MPPPPTTIPPTEAPAPLAAEERGDGPRLVLAHGFTQTGRVWGTMDDDLATDHRVVAVDMPGHGRSTDRASTLVEGALQLGRAGGHATYVGYSMGARFCLHLALACPQLVASLVLISGTAGIDDPVERRARRLADAALAAQLDPVGGSGAMAVPVETFLQQWMDQPLFAGVPPAAAGLAERRRNTGRGLASSLRLAGTGTQLPLWSLLDRLSMPVLVVSGGDDEKFTALGTRMVDAIGATAHHIVVPDAGHAPHLQHPNLVAGLIRRHLAGRPA